MQKILLFLFALVSCLYAPAQPTDRTLSKQLDKLIAPVYPSVSPGYVVLVARKGQVVYKKAFGLANLELQTPMKADMVFRLGSITKQYTAIAILQLIEQGKLSLGDSIQKFLPAFPSKGHTITVENLLTHTSGIIDYQALNTPAANDPYLQRKDMKPAELIDLFKNEPLSFVPGTRFAYSNSNYFLLGAIIEKVSGQQYAEYLRQHIFSPAGLSRTYYEDDREIIPGRVSGYAKLQDGFKNKDFTSPSIAFSAGALMSTVEDLLKWHEALYADKLVRPETLNKAFTVYRPTEDSSSEYGYGWFITTRRGYKSIEHAGRIEGFQSEEIYLPELDIFIAILANALPVDDNYEPFISLTNEIATLAEGKPLVKGIILDTSVLRQYTGVYQYDPRHLIVVTLENGRLDIEAAAGGLPKSPLAATKENHFFLKIASADIEFVKDGSGKVIKMIAHTKGRDDVSLKIR